jgi:hypothetical protein
VECKLSRFLAEQPYIRIIHEDKVESGRSHRKPLEQAVPIAGKCAKGLQQGEGLGAPTPCSILDKPEAHFSGLRKGFSARMARFDPQA